MTVYTCKQCKQFIIKGLVNEFNETFCTTDCYEIYCNMRGYKSDISKLKPTENK